MKRCLSHTRHIFFQNYMYPRDQVGKIAGIDRTGKAHWKYYSNDPYLTPFAYVRLISR